MQVLRWWAHLPARHVLAVIAVLLMLPLPVGGGSGQSSPVADYLRLFPVLQFGADPTGATDTTAQCQTAIDACSAAGGGVVPFSYGTFKLNLAVHPLSAAYYCALNVPGNVTLMGQRRGTTLLLAPNQAVGNDLGNTNCVVMNRNILAGGDLGITFLNLTIDGNAGNQAHTHNGIFLIRTRNAHHERVRVQDCRGTALGGQNETFHFETQIGTDSHYLDCEAAGTAGATATGFSADGHTGGRWSHCVAHEMSVSNGFTHYNCAGLEYANCRSYLNGNIGFNSEGLTDYVVYVNCQSGGIASATAGGAYPFAASQHLGNGAYGWVLNFSLRAKLVNCESRFNGNDGLHTIQDVNTQIASCEFSDNGGYGAIFNGCTDLQTANVSASRNAKTGLYCQSNAGVECSIHWVGVKANDNGTNGGAAADINGVYLANATTGEIYGLRATDTRAGGAKVQNYGIRLENTARIILVGLRGDGNVTAPYKDSVGTSAIAGVDNGTDKTWQWGAGTILANDDASALLIKPGAVMWTPAGTTPLVLKDFFNVGQLALGRDDGTYLHIEALDSNRSVKINGQGTGIVGVVGFLQTSTGIYAGTPAAGVQGNTAIYGGTGAPNNANGNNGDYYFRSDGAAATHIYFKSAGVWAGII